MAAMKKQIALKSFPAGKLKQGVGNMQDGWVQKGQPFDPNKDMGCPDEATLLRWQKAGICKDYTDPTVPRAVPADTGNLPPGAADAAAKAGG